MLKKKSINCGQEIFICVHKTLTRGHGVGMFLNSRVSKSNATSPLSPLKQTVFHVFFIYIITKYQSCR